MNMGLKPHEIDFYQLREKYSAILVDRYMFLKNKKVPESGKNNFHNLKI